MNSCVGRVLVIEDEPLLRISIRDSLQKEGWTVDVAEDGAQGLVLFERFLHEFVLTDLVMPRIGGMEVLRRVKSIQPATTVVIITAHGTVEKAVEAMREGAVDFITKPFSMTQLYVRLSNVCSFRRLSEQNVRLQEQLETRYSFSNIIGKSKVMQEVFELIRVIADSDASVLIQGESGTGKELVAAAIHYNSPRRARPYIRVSCASLPESLIESELFGYERGAFTGASQRRIGRFEAASGGTLFLDEIGELPLPFQVKLLRVLQERQIERLGSNRPIDVDLRIVSASLRPLEEEIAEGRFRQDLFFRTNTATIQLPPLRERKEDISLLAQVFLREFADERGKDVEGYSDEVLEVFDAYDWPGNVRELRNAVERALLFCRGPQVTVADLPQNFHGLKSSRTVRAAGDVVRLHEAVVRAEINAIYDALAATEGRRSKAADLLGVSRKTLWEKMKAYDLEVR
ncbi:MAG: sigma-54-dependent Fis family transcriptional regulator [Acidobacteria bacterium]|nr:MAG: sigma-54-dependent Fis family transcriptional regulator [Acidobacteriota bacterium]RLE31867.1 MAG: sigma-54-dependent Fis family transcriptional regulator [Acidobacteriota bacterium]